MNVIKHDGKILYPLGGASYVYEQDLVGYLANRLPRKNIKISIGAQPNGSPHFGTLVVFSLAFALAELLNKQNSKTATVTFEIIDTAPGKELVIDGLRYQISLRDSGQADVFLAQYEQLLNILRGLADVDFILRRQSDFNSQPTIPVVLRKVVENEVLLAPVLDPKGRRLKIRVPCPDCGLTDKDAVKNTLFKNYVEAYCPRHGKFKNYYENSGRFEYNTPLRNLIRALAYTADSVDPKKGYCWLRVTGADYAGFYQEELLYRTASLMGYRVDKLPIILYAPLIVDWSGAKLSKSLYVKQEAYKYLPDYLVSYEQFYKRFGEKGVAKLYREVKSWLESPYKLFRAYSVYYFMEVFGYE